MSNRLERHKPLPRPAEPPYERTEVSVGEARQSTHYVIAFKPTLSDDIVRFLRVSMGYHLGDGLPLCGNDGEQQPPLPKSQPCGSCESYLEIFEGDLDDARWAKAEETIAWPAIDDAVRAAVRARPDGVGW
jgi:hypothetical protein